MSEERRPAREHTRTRSDTGKVSLVNEGVHYPDDVAAVDRGRVDSLRESTATLLDAESPLMQAHVGGWSEGVRAMGSSLVDMRSRVAAVYEAESASEALQFVNDRAAQDHPQVFARLADERMLVLGRFEHADSLLANGADRGDWQEAVGAAYSAFDDYAFKEGMLVATEQLTQIAPVVSTGATPENVAGLAAAWGAAETAEQAMVDVFPGRQEDIEQCFNGVYQGIADMYGSQNPTNHFSDALESLERRVLADRREPTIPFASP